MFQNNSVLKKKTFFEPISVSKNWRRIQNFKAAPIFKPNKENNNLAHYFCLFINWAVYNLIIAKATWIEGIL